MKDLNRTFIYSILICIGTTVYAYSADNQNISLNKKTVVSRTDPGSSPAFLNDGNYTTIWNSGYLAPQWAYIDFGGKYDIDSIKLHTEQTPVGNINYAIVATRDSLNWLKMDTFYHYTTYKETITRKYPSKMINVRGVKITITFSPSWIAFREIEVFGGVTSDSTYASTPNVFYSTIFYETEGELTLFNLVGKTVLKTSTPINKLSDLLPAGIYVYTFKQNNKILKGKLVNTPNK